jgi:tetrahydromethanopterin S-methyltransferase subunit F
MYRIQEEESDVKPESAPVLSTCAIIGISIGGVVLLILLVLLIMWWINRRSKSGKLSSGNPADVVKIQMTSEKIKYNKFFL